MIGLVSTVVGNRMFSKVLEQGTISKKVTYKGINEDISKNWIASRVERRKECQYISNHGSGRMVCSEESC